jgi:hypothetical protein
MANEICPASKKALALYFHLRQSQAAVVTPFQNKKQGNKNKGKQKLHVSQQKCQDVRASY